MILLILALIASYKLGGWWAVVLCFCMLMLLAPERKDN